MADPAQTTQVALQACESFWYGFGGAVIGEVFTLWKIRELKKEELPHWVFSLTYWIPTILMILVGGGLAFLYTKSGSQMSPLIAAHIGASAPIIIGSLVGKAPDIK